MLKNDDMLVIDSGAEATVIKMNTWKTYATGNLVKSSNFRLSKASSLFEKR